MSAERLATESPEYRKLRNELLEAEIALKEQREHVAALRRQLPTDTICPDYRLERVHLAEGNTVSEVALSELFAKPDQPLVLMQFMFGGAQEQFCPMCTMWADGYDGAVPHLAQRVNFGVVVAGDIAAFSDYGRSRGWRNLQLLSSAGSPLKTDLRFENEDGSQLPGVSVFTRAADGSPRHFYSACAVMGGGHFRGMDLLSPVWNFFDLTPEGRGEFFPQREY